MTYAYEDDVYFRLRVDIFFLRNSCWYQLVWVLVITEDKIKELPNG